MGIYHICKWTCGLFHLVNLWHKYEMEKKGWHICHGRALMVGYRGSWFVPTTTFRLRRGMWFWWIDAFNHSCFPWILILSLTRLVSKSILRLEKWKWRELICFYSVMLNLKYRCWFCFAKLTLIIFAFSPSQFFKRLEFEIQILPII